MGIGGEALQLVRGFDSLAPGNFRAINSCPHSAVLGSGTYQDQTHVGL